METRVTTNFTPKNPVSAHTPATETQYSDYSTTHIIGCIVSLFGLYAASANATVMCAGLLMAYVALSDAKQNNILTFSYDPSDPVTFSTYYLSAGLGLFYALASVTIGPTYSVGAALSMFTLCVCAYPIIKVPQTALNTKVAKSKKMRRKNLKAAKAHRI
jgi:hypothetical protein